ncbi:MAG: cation-transporting P-type ATPase [Candidatus Melainabacteria bacterium]|nr:cation-transporting P-type ATPase [Candidatus Melainabacteria bacterium]
MALLAPHPSQSSTTTDPSDSFHCHAQPIEAVLARFNCNPETGLTELQWMAQQKKLAQQYPKGFGNRHGGRMQRLFLSQFKRGVVLLLFGAAALSFYLGHAEEGLAVLYATMAMFSIYLITELQVQKSFGEYRADIGGTRCSVRRAGKIFSIEPQELVPGDIWLFSPGELVPADARIISRLDPHEDLQADESLLTGESTLVLKDPNALHAPEQELTGQRNMLFAGTRVKTGRGEALITAVGQQATVGRIAKMAAGTKKRETPLTTSLNRLGLKMFILVGILASLVVYLESSRGASTPEMIRLALFMLIAAVPEMLPSIASLVFSLGLGRLAKEQVIVKNLAALESIGSISRLCTDKTGTLTENNLSVHQVFLPDLGVVSYNPAWAEARQIPGPSVEALLRVARLNNSTVMGGIRGVMMGDPIDVALHRCTPASLEKGYHRVKEWAFDPTHMRMATLLKDASGQYLSMIKGAPESIINNCKHYLNANGQVVTLTPGLRSEFILINRELAMNDALRVIGFAQKPMLADIGDPYMDATFVGWICLVDPPKAGVLEAIEACQEAGIQLTVITGDQKATAAMTARKLGILTGPIEQQVWTAEELRQTLLDARQKVPDTVTVFARTKPEEKLAIVESLQRSGHLVAMVGDGMNDTPALQKSDVAVAMGLHGADAAKDCADIVLLNDRFQGIVMAILESRVLMHNMKLCVQYLMSCNLGLILLLVAGALMGSQLPLSGLQVLWLNVITVTLPALVLAFEPGNARVVRQAQWNSQTGFPARGDMILVLYWSLLIAGAGLAAFQGAVRVGHLPVESAITLTFTTVALTQTFTVFSIGQFQSGTSPSLFLQDCLKTPITWIVVALAIGFQSLALYLPWLQRVLDTMPLDVWSWGAALGLSVATVLVAMMTVGGGSGSGEQTPPSR